MRTFLFFLSFSFLLFFICFLFLCLSASFYFFTFFFFFWKPSSQRAASARCGITGAWPEFWALVTLGEEAEPVRGGIWDRTRMWWWLPRSKTSMTLLRSRPIITIAVSQKPRLLFARSSVICKLWNWEREKGYVSISSDFR